jgi:hypothetical protein
MESSPVAEAEPVIEEEPPPPEEFVAGEDPTCPRRRRHLADESRWMQCDKCRKEMAVYARRLVCRGE